MTTEVLRLPEIPEGPAETQLAAMKTYLYRLTEQLQYLLSAQHQQGLRAEQALGTVESRVVDSPRLAQQVLALSDRHLRGQYVGYADFEKDRQRQEGLIWEDRGRLNEAGAAAAPETPLALRLEGLPGYQTREEDNIRFVPIPEGQKSLLTQVYEGRWQVE